VLSFFSDGVLECAINVGAGVEGSECPVTYKALGEHRVTTIYTTGEASATESEVEDITPLGTETTLAIGYTPETPVEAGVASGLWRVGVLTAQTGASPPGVHSQLGCGSGAVERLDKTGCYQLAASPSYVFVESTGTCLTKVFISKETGDPGVSGGSLTVTAEGIPASAIEAGMDHLRASVATAGGYAGSEATSSLEFSPAYEAQAPC
jgi:hypothetical protein